MQGACEYCRLLQGACGVTFHLEHILPSSQGGETSLKNLALSCPGCNLAKANKTTGFDKAGQIQILFNPRDFNPWLLGWHLNFILDPESGLIGGRTPIGEATVSTLKVNDSLRLNARQLQIQVGLIA